MTDHGLRYLANCSMLFTELPLLERPRGRQGRRVRRRRVLVAVARPAGAGRRRGRRLRRRRRRTPASQLVGLNFFAGDLAGPDCGVLSIPDRGRSSSATTSTSRSASASGSASGPSTPSTATGSTASTAAGAGRARPRATSACAAEAAAGIGATVLVEPVSGPKPYPLRTAADVARGRRPASAPTGAPTSASSATCTTWPSTATTSTPPSTPYADRIAHVQIADARAAASPAPATSTSTATRRARRPRLRRLGRPGVQARPPRPPRASPGCRASARQPALTADRLHARNEEHTHDHHRLHRTRHHGQPDGRPPASRPATTSSAYNRARAGSSRWSTPAAAAADIDRRGRQGRRRRRHRWCPTPPTCRRCSLGEDGVFANAKPGTPDHRLLQHPPRRHGRAGRAGRAQGLPAARRPGLRRRGRRRRTPRCRSWSAATQADFAEAKPILDAVGKTIVHVGPSGAGQTVKAANQLIVAGNIELARRGDRLPRGLRRRHSRPPSRCSAAGWPARTVLDQKGANMLAGNFEPGLPDRPAPQGHGHRHRRRPRGRRRRSRSARVVAQLMASRARQRRRRPRPLGAAARRRAALRPLTSVRRPRRELGAPAMARMTAADAAVEILEAGGRHQRLRPARRRDQPVLRRDARPTAGSTTCWPGTSRAPRTWPRATPAPRPATSASASAPSGPAGTDMITGLYSAQRRLDPDPVHHRPGAGRQAAQGGLPGRRHRVASPSRSPRWRSRCSSRRRCPARSSRRST